jgi:flavin reductase (DIM6/NTAB) family NADH-FMN oxidoreductase RutF
MNFTTNTREKMKRSLGAKSLVYPTPVFVIGTYDKDDKPNVMTASWSGICCSDPPCIAVSLRKATYTYGNILERNAFTVNVPSKKYVKEADYFGSVSGRKLDKIADTNLTAVNSTVVDAPFIKEFPLILECDVIHTFELGLHTQFVGQIKDIKIEEDCTEKDGSPSIELVDPFVYAPGKGGYYGISNRLGNAYQAGDGFKHK